MLGKSGAVFVAVVLIVVSMLAACKSNSDNGASSPSSSSSPHASRPLELQVYAAINEEGFDPETNLFSNQLEKMFNIDFKWETVPAQESVTRRQLMFASGNYPAVLLMDAHYDGSINRPEQMRLGKEKMIVPLNDLIDQYAPHIVQAMKDVPGFRPAITTPDGNIYTLPGLDICFHCAYSLKMWVNSEWMARLNLDIPQTTEDFYRMLKAFVEQDPNGNGIADEIGMSGATDGWHTNVAGYLMNAFIYNNTRDFLRVVDGRVDLSADEPEWREGLVYIKKLYDEGLIDRQSFTQNKDALMQKAMPDDRSIAIIGAQPAAYFGEFLLPDDPRYKQYDTIPPVKGPNGVQQTGYYFGIGPGQFAITNKATGEQRIAAIRLADYLYTSKGFMDKWYGPEGEAWRKPADRPDTLGRPAKFELVPDYDGVNERWDTLGPGYAGEDWYNSWAVPDDLYTKSGTELRLYNETKKNYAMYAPPEYVPDMYYFDEDMEDYALLSTQINSYVNEHLVRFITGDKSLASDWDSYVAGFQKLRLDKYLEIVQRNYDAIMK